MNLKNKLNDTDIRIAYENRCYGDIIVAVEKNMTTAIKKAKKEVFDDIEKLFPEDLCNSTRIMGLYMHITDLKRQHLSKKH